MDNKNLNWDWDWISNNDMKYGKEKWIKKKVKIAIEKKINYRILSNIFNSDICEIIVNL